VEEVRIKGARSWSHCRQYSNLRRACFLRSEPRCASDLRARRLTDNAEQPGPRPTSLATQRPSPSFHRTLDLPEPRRHGRKKKKSSMFSMIHQRPLPLGSSTATASSNCSSEHNFTSRTGSASASRTSDLVVGEVPVVRQKSCWLKCVVLNFAESTNYLNFQVSYVLRCDGLDLDDI